VGRCEVSDVAADGLLRTVACPAERLAASQGGTDACD
jgi:hypothetical protein